MVHNGISVPVGGGGIGASVFIHGICIICQRRFRVCIVLPDNPALFIIGIDDKDGSRMVLFPYQTAVLIIVIINAFAQRIGGLYQTTVFIGKQGFPSGMVLHSGQQSLIIITGSKTHSAYRFRNAHAVQSIGKFYCFAATVHQFRQFSPGIEFPDLTIRKI